MPWWLSALLPFILNLIKTYGIPALEQKFPALIPIINEILALLGGRGIQKPSPELVAAADHYNAKKSGLTPA